MIILEEKWMLGCRGNWYIRPVSRIWVKKNFVGKTLFNGENVCSYVLLAKQMMAVGLDVKCKLQLRKTSRNSHTNAVDTTNT